VAFKRFKITEEDWRNRKKWDTYQQAICDMVERTSTGNAPWTLVEANDKNYARVKVLRTLCERIEAELKRSGPAQVKKGRKRKSADADAPAPRKRKR
jgi:polyphosphate kinase 2 (PPK2 family)